MLQIFDTHAHLYFTSFDDNRDQVIAECEAAGVTHQIQIGCDELSCLAALELAESQENFYCTLGLHPCDVDKLGVRDPEYHRYAGLTDYKLKNHTPAQFFAWIEALFLENEDKVVGFGETGFDLYHRNTPELFALQAECFAEHIRLCKKYDRALVIHTRDSSQETLKFLQDSLQPGLNPGSDIPRGVVHAFSEGPEFAQIMTEQFGFHLGIGGVATYPKNEHVREAIKSTPIEFLITETDTPFLTPHKARKSGIKTNTPQYIPEVITLIAELKELSVEDCATQLFENAQRCFGIES